MRKLPKKTKQEIERLCRLAFEGFNDGGAKCYDEQYYSQTFRPKWIETNVNLNIKNNYEPTRFTS